MASERKSLLQLADRVAQGERIDWRQETLESPNEQTRAGIGALRVVASIAEHLKETEGLETVPAVATIQHPSKTWGPLEIRGILGSGTTGIVYRAYDPELDREVALKLLSPDLLDTASRERLRDEGRRLARVKHENVVKVHGVAEHDGQIGLWMEYIQGETLSERLAKDGSLGEAEAIHVGIAVARAVAAVHAQGIIHQDIKAQNVMRETGGRLVLMDFGSGVEIGVGPLSAGGTPYYMASEILEGGVPTRQADVYSVGVLLYHLVTGEFPVEGGTLAEIRSAHRQGRGTTLGDVRPDVGPEFVRVVERALSADPERRYASAGKLELALEELRGVASPISDPEPQPDPDRGPGPVSPPDHDPVSPPDVPWWKRIWQAMPAPLRLTTCLLLLIGLALGAWGIIGLSNRFDVEATLYRVEARSREELFSGAQVEVGDGLTLNIEASEPVHVYVLNQGLGEAPSLLFPMSGADLQNPLPSGESHELPGTMDGGRFAWEITSAEGGETFLVIASRSPLGELEALLDDVASVQPGEIGDYPQIDVDSMNRLRGISGVRRLEDASGRGQDPSDLLEHIENLEKGATGNRGVWMRKIILLNPGD